MIENISIFASKFEASLSFAILDLGNTHYPRPFMQNETTIQYCLEYKSESLFTHANAVLRI